MSGLVNKFLYVKTQMRRSSDKTNAHSVSQNVHLVRKFGNYCVTWVNFMQDLKSRTYHYDSLITLSEEEPAWELPFSSYSVLCLPLQAVSGSGSPWTRPSKCCRATNPSTPSTCGGSSSAAPPPTETPSSRAPRPTRRENQINWTFAVIWIDDLLANT